MAVYWGIKYTTKELGTITLNVLLTQTTQTSRELHYQISKLGNGIKYQHQPLRQEARDLDHPIFTALKVCIRSKIHDFVKGMNKTLVLGKNTSTQNLLDNSFKP